MFAPSAGITTSVTRWETGRSTRVTAAVLRGHERRLEYEAQGSEEERAKYIHRTATVTSRDRACPTSAEFDLDRTPRQRERAPRSRGAGPRETLRRRRPPIASRPRPKRR